jgi:hypothetical protein
MMAKNIAIPPLTAVGFLCQRSAFGATTQFLLCAIFITIGVKIKLKSKEEKKPKKTNFRFIMIVLNYLTSV